MEPKDTLISVRNLTMGYGNGVVVRDVSFDISEGDIFAILGRSGCGKTTLFKAIIGLLNPIEGEVIIDGDRVLPVLEGGSDRVLRKIGVLFQSGALFSSMTVAENLAFPLRQYTSLPEGLIEKIITMRLSEVGLDHAARMLPSELSGGMQKRAALARAMVLDPKILFFDEPSAGLDPVTSAELDNMILKINETLGTTIVLVTHELPSIFKIVRRAVMLDPEEKTIIADGKPSDLRKSEDSRVRDFFTRLGSEE
ncbi:ABC transporter ATP-binding protein [Desulfomonile tiedjei]|uniref:ABC-type transport system involved in resistance to organic solvents, ATPase component n=1 Tax=Desulfomonile tiedjei (strain ATCC 49306 / DSM 6799 / DCB-1) TaxID=706587 RepID=I4C464_DESTA|nr:ATP-binding cassette domain-containing protein [Desulfomonile tiedjei]AFM24355.1 ABC-type transport system involved in resistance to organic solvents, ATPase component [Desulfomonile tiedjei DSM 6799]